MQDLVAGQIDLMHRSGLELAAACARRQASRPIAVTAKTRLPSAPDIPTVDEAGLPGFYVSIWHAIWVPKGTPKDIIAKLNAAVVDALADPAVRKRLAELGQEIPPREQQTPEALARVPQGRDREVVADDQGGQHQGESSVPRPDPGSARPRTTIAARGGATDETALRCRRRACSARAVEPSRKLAGADRASILVGFPAGTAPDVTSRLIGDKMAPNLGKPVVIENVTGASGNIAVERSRSRRPTATRW